VVHIDPSCYKASIAIEALVNHSSKAISQFNFDSIHREIGHSAPFP